MPGARVLIGIAASSDFMYGRLLGPPSDLGHVAATTEFSLMARSP